MQFKPMLFICTGGVSSYLFLKGVINLTDKHNKGIQKLSSQEVQALKIRDYTLRNNGFYNSEMPYLRAMAIASYNENRDQHKEKYLAKNK